MGNKLHVILLCPRLSNAHMRQWLEGQLPIPLLVPFINGQHLAHVLRPYRT